jgi:hypothetical protein
MNKCLQQNPARDPAATEEELAGELEENKDRERCPLAGTKTGP